MSVSVQDAPGAKAGAPGRPREGDDAVARAAAGTFSKEAAKSSPDILEGLTTEEFADHVLSVLPVWDTDGMELARAMERRYGYELDRDLVDLMARWHTHAARARDAAVRDWVAATAPVPPFADVARVTYRDHRGEISGVAYANDRYGPTAQCLVVPDGEDRFVRDGAFSGGCIVAWEDLKVTGPATERDMALYEASLLQDIRSDERRALQDFVRMRDRAFSDAVTAAASEAEGLTTATLRASLAEGLRALADAMAESSPDAASRLAATVTGGLRTLCGRETRAAYHIEGLAAGPAPVASSD